MTKADVAKAAGDPLSRSTVSEQQIPQLGTRPEGAIDDRSRWNLRYQNEVGDGPSRVLTAAQQHFPLLETARPTALDLAGGAGRHSIWLAQQGFACTLLDVSDLGLDLAAQRAEAAGVEIRCIQRDLLESGLPRGRWDFVLCCLFLHRPMLASVADLLNPGGLFVLIQPTRSNLQRFRRPPARFLLDDGELPGLIEAAGLEIRHYREGWLEDGRHDAIAIAVKTGPRCGDPL